MTFSARSRGVKPRGQSLRQLPSDIAALAGMVLRSRRKRPRKRPKRQSASQVTRQEQDSLGSRGGEVWGVASRNPIACLSPRPNSTRQRPAARQRCSFNNRLLNQGVIAADTPGSRVTVKADPLTNTGILQASAGGLLIIENLQGDAGNLVVSSGGELAAQRDRGESPLAFHNRRRPHQARTIISYD